MSVAGYNSLYTRTLVTDTQVPGYRRGVTSMTDTPQIGVSVDNIQWFNILQATTDTYNLKGLNIFFR